MLKTLKSLAKSLPYPLFLQLFYLWDRAQWRRRAEAARKRAGIPGLDEVDLLQVKNSDTLFVLGSGPSINKISSKRWEMIAGHDTLGINFWLYHPFVPKFYFFESIEAPASPAGFDCFLTLANRRAVDYTSTIKIAMEFHRRGKQTFEHLPPAFRKHLFAAHKIEAPARTENELTRALQYLKDRGDFQATGRFSSLLKYASSLTSILVFALKLGYKRVVLCGIDLKTADYFFQDRSLYRESWELPAKDRKERHGTDISLTWRMPVTQVVAVIKHLLLDPAGTEMYVENPDSALWPMLPALPMTPSDWPWLSNNRPASSQTWEADTESEAPNWYWANSTQRKGPA